MSIYKLRSLGKYGVITDVPAYDLPPEAWDDANNIRFRAGRLEKMNGYMPGLLPSGDSQPVLSFCQEPESNALIYATSSHKDPANPSTLIGGKIYRVQGALPPQNITSTAKATSGYQARPDLTWDYTTLSNIIVLSNPLDNPEFWTPNTAINPPPNQKMLPLPGWGVPRHLKPDGTPYSDDANNILKNCPVVDWKCQRIRGYKNYLMALNMTEPLNGISGAATSFPQRIRWSNIADVNSAPPDWLEDNVTTDGGYIDLSDCTGSIIDGRPLRDAFIIYTDRETYIMQYTGGDFVFSVQKLFPDSGLLNANCVTEFEGTNHFVISEDDVFVHDGSSKQTIATDIVKERLLGDITSVNFNATKVFTYPTRKEIWVCYVTNSGQQGDDENFACNKAAIWNWKNSTWTFTDLPDIHWLNEVIAPNTDIRAWSNPDATTPLKPVTKIVLDSPVYSLPNDKTFRIDVLYKPGEGFTSDTEGLTWDTSDHTIATMVADPFDYSAILTPVAGKTGTVTITVKVKGKTGADFEGSYPVKITAAGTATGDRHHADDPDKDSDPLEPTPVNDPVHGAYRPSQFPDQPNSWPDPDGENSPTQTPNSNTHDREQWDRKGFSFAARSFLACSHDTSFYFMDSGQTQDRYVKGGLPTTTPVVATATRYGISLQENEDSLARHKTFRTIYPLMSGEGKLRWNIGGSNDAYDQPSFSQSSVFEIGNHYKIDTLVNYRYLAIALRDEGVGTWSLSGMDIDYFLGGNR